MSYYASLEGSNIARLRDQLLSPNGVDLWPDEKFLYPADTLTGRLWAVDIVESGVLGPPTGFGPGPACERAQAISWSIARRSRPDVRRDGAIRMGLR